MSHIRHCVSVIVLSIGLAGFLRVDQAIASLSQTMSQTQAATQALAGLALPFEENQGQSDAGVAFQARTLAGPLFVTHEGELVWHLIPPHAMSYPHESPEDRTPVDAAPAWPVVERFVAGKPQPTGDGLSPTQVNHFHGNNPGQWHHGTRTWARVSLGQVWDGVEVSLAARGKSVEKVFTVAQGADARAIAIEVAGGRLALEDNGALAVEVTSASDQSTQKAVRFTAPVAWQEINGRRQPVPVSYRLAGESKNRYGFTLGSHDPTRPVVIDPLSQATYLGGNSIDRVTALAVTADAVYVAGDTYSTNFPGTTGGAQAMPKSKRWKKGVRHGKGEQDAFVVKLSRDLRTLIQATYLGGSGSEEATALAVTADAVYVTGETRSNDFPNTAGGAQGTPGGNRQFGEGDAFVAKLSLDLRTLVQSTYLGGSTAVEGRSNSDYATTLAIADDAVYVAGYTHSIDFPGTTSGPQATIGGGFSDAFVTKLSRDLRTLIQSTYLGGSAEDRANALAVTTDAVYVTGLTWSGDFPGRSGGAQETHRKGWTDGFVAKLSRNLRTLIQSTYLGGSNGDNPRALAVTADAVYVAGETYSADFPGTTGGAQGTFGGKVDGFVAKLTPNLHTLTQSTYLGGGAEDKAYALAVTADAVYVAGWTRSGDCPFLGTTCGTQGMFGGSIGNAFLAKLSRDLGSLAKSTYLGGHGEDKATALAVATDAIYVAGETESATFPSTIGGAQGAFGGVVDAFVAKLSLSLEASNTTHALTVKVNGLGMVTSHPVGIHCGTNCSEKYLSGTDVTLTATEKTGAAFTGWGGDCSGTGHCQVTMNTAKAITATFDTSTKSNRNVILLQHTSPAIMDTGVGNDTYILTPSLLTGTENLVLSDTQGNNLLQLDQGLSIAKSEVAATVLRLTLSNGAQIAVMGADTFQYDVGGNAAAGRSTHTPMGFAAFTQGTLGVAVPATGISTGGPVTIPNQ